MKRQGNLWPQLVSFENLWLAFHKACLGKANRPAVTTFCLDLESQLFQLQHELCEFTYFPGTYRQFIIRERKPRLISAAPFRDRVVHHAIMNLLEPILEKRFYPHSYACRQGKGTHRAVDQYQRWANRWTYVMKLDIARYFPSIQHERLKIQLCSLIKDSYFLALLDRVIDGSPTEQHGVGLPIGNLTSQYFANLYLNSIDHWLALQPSCSAYLRYVDDLLILGDDKAELWYLRDQLQKQLEELGLCLHPKKQQVMPTRERVDVFGYKVSRSRRWLRNDNGYRFRRKFHRALNNMQNANMYGEDFHASVMSWIGHAQHGETHGLRKAIFREVSFSSRSD